MVSSGNRVPGCQHSPPPQRHWPQTPSQLSVIAQVKDVNMDPGCHTDHRYLNSLMLATWTKNINTDSNCSRITGCRRGPYQSTDPDITSQVAIGPRQQRGPWTSTGIQEASGFTLNILLLLRTRAILHSLITQG